MTIYELSKKYGFKKIFNHIYKNFLKKPSDLNKKNLKVEEDAVRFRSIFDSILNSTPSLRDNSSIKLSRNEKGFLDISFSNQSKPDIFHSQINCDIEIEELNLISFIFWSLK